MLEDYFEDFILLTRTQTPDSLGGTETQWADGPAFRGGVTQVVGRETSVGGLSALCTVPMLLHDWEVTLAQGDRVRRARDGAVYRVTGLSGDMRTPGLSGMAFAQVPVERLVTAP